MLESSFCSTENNRSLIEKAVPVDNAPVFPHCVAALEADPQNKALIPVSTDLRLLDIKVRKVPGYISIRVYQSVSLLDNFDITCGPEEPYLSLQQLE